MTSATIDFYIFKVKPLEKMSGNFPNAFISEAFVLLNSLNHPFIGVAYRN